MTRALAYAPFHLIEDHFRVGWMVSFPNGPMRHHFYGIEMKWICDCSIPRVMR